jgi:precorrin-6A/cobalt-precorrin-6A reductase
VPTVLVLGGTGEARRLPPVLLPAYRVISSLAGRVADPALPAGEVRIGGFGGPEGLRDYLLTEHIDAVVDATHPFAATISANAATACATTGIPLLILRRPGYPPDDAWLRVPSVAAAAAHLTGERVFLTTGRQTLHHFADLSAPWFLLRCVDPPEPPLPPRLKILLARGPFTVPGELALMRSHAVDVLITKDSGGPMTAAKLVAARELGVRVIVVDRPPTPSGVPVVPTVEAAAEYLSRLRL